MTIDVGALVERWKHGDPQAAEAIYNHHRTRVYGLAYSLLADEAEAEDAAQDALTYALTNIARYSPQLASFSTWLHTITVSRCRDRLRRRKRFTFSISNWLREEEDIPDPAENQEQQAMESEMQGEILKAVQNLSLPLREAILLRFWLGHTFREMAEILGCPVPTVQSRVRLAYQKLKTSLAQTDVVHGFDLEEAGQ